MALFAGLMSGTSLDGVDAVLAELTAGTLQNVGHVHRPFPPALRDELLALNRPGTDELHRAALAANAVATVYAGALHDVLRATGRHQTEVRALGAHGQTVRHRPREFDGTGYTLQLLNGALLAELGGVDVVCDFRSRDLAAGGEGAPLVPAFHAQRFGQHGRDVAVLNLGGIANLTLLRADGGVSGFDCGPGNALMDHWCQVQRGQAFDDGGRWAASGQVQPALLARLLGDPYFDRAPPKSTGRDLFHAGWLDAALAGLPPMAAEDVMATLAALTVRGALDAIDRHAPATERLLVCGGGAFNAHLMQALAAGQPGMVVQSTSLAGVPPDQVEALAFAWLAWAFVERLPGNRVAVTGARGERVLGALYPASAGP